MSIIHKNERGMTLVELLAALVLGVIVMGIVSTILVQSVNEQTRQTSNNGQLTEMRYVLKLVTKDMRKSTNLKDNQSFTINNSSIATYTFDPSNQSVYRDNVVIARKIKSFSIKEASQGVQIRIEAVNGHVIDTELYFRSGNK